MPCHSCGFQFLHFEPQLVDFVRQQVETVFRSELAFAGSPRLVYFGEELGGIERFHGLSLGQRGLVCHQRLSVRTCHPDRSSIIALGATSSWFSAFSAIDRFKKNSLSSDMLGKKMNLLAASRKASLDILSSYNDNASTYMDNVAFILSAVSPS